MDDIQIILTTKQVLFNFSISREQLRRWTERGLRKVKRGEFDLKDIIQFRDEFITGFGHDEMAKAKLRRESAKARYQELLTLEKEGTLIDRGEVIRHNLYIIQEVKNSFCQLHRVIPGKIGSLDPRAWGSVVKEEVRRILNRLHQGLGKGKRRRL